MKGANDIYILETNGAYRVRPSVWSTDARGASPKISFRNMTNWKVVLLLPNAPLDPAASSMVTLDPGARDERRLRTKNVGDPAEQHSYSVIVMTNIGTVVASGESDPIVIIDPPV